jgi:hypothetical protein
MGRTTCTEPQCLYEYKVVLCIFFTQHLVLNVVAGGVEIVCDVLKVSEQQSRLYICIYLQR